MTSITFYGGVNEIGGNKILLEDRGTCVFVDFGKSFSRFKKYYGMFNRPRCFEDYLETGQVPKIKGIYRYEQADAPAVNGVILSHSHTDHCAYISFLIGDIPVYCSKQTLDSIAAFEKVTRKSLETQITSFREDYDSERKVVFRNMPFPKPTKKEPDRRATHYRTMIEEKIPPPRQGRKFVTKSKGSVDNIEYELCHVDHSVIDAYGCILRTSDTSIVYTGDIMFHGPAYADSFEFIRKAKEENPDVLITEGTRIDEKENRTEEDVGKLSKNLVEKAKGLVFANFQYRNIHRVSTFKNVASDTNRTFVTSERAMGYWKAFKEHFSGALSDICMYEKGAKTRISARIPGSIKTIEDEEIRLHPERYLIHLTNYEVAKMIDFWPPEGSLMILSMSEAHDEEEELELERLTNWCDRFGLPMYRIHSSGHMCGYDFEWMIKEINPKVILPLHTTFEKAELIKKMFPDKTKILKEGQKFEATAKISSYF